MQGPGATHLVKYLAKGKVPSENVKDQLESPFDLFSKLPQWSFNFAYADLAKIIIKIKTYVDF